jgi:hypothetical protein
MTFGVPERLTGIIKSEEEVRMPEENKNSSPAEAMAKRLYQPPDWKPTPVAKPAGRICADSGCELAGKEQPLENFREGYTICKKCHGRRAVAGRGTKRAEGKPMKKPGPAPKAKEETPKPSKQLTLEQLRDDPLLKALFLGYENLLEMLEQEAEAEIRDPRMQLLWIVRERYLRKGL